MSLTQHFDDGSSVVSEPNNSLDDDQTRLNLLTKVEVDTMVIHSIQTFIEPIMVNLIQRVVKEEIESAVEKLLIRMHRNSGNRTSTSEPQSLQLLFLNNISLPVLTGRNIKGKESATIKVALVDGISGEVVKTGPEAAANVEIVVLEEDFGGGEGDGWTLEEFKNKIVKGRGGKKSFLKGNTYLNLNEGIGFVDDIKFTHNSGWMRNSKFRLGARVVDNFFGTRVKEAKTEPFVVQDRRIEFSEKHYPPSLSDEVWRLKGIGKRGAFHKRLSGANINTVEDFLNLSSKNPQRLQDILKAGPKKWEVLMNHARTCMIDIDKLSENEKADADKLVTSASEHQEEVFFGDDTSMHGLPHSSNALYSSLSPRLESTPNDNFGTSPMIDSYDQTQPSTSYQGQWPDSPILTPGLEDWLQRLVSGNCNLQSESPNVESHANVYKAQRRWRMVYSLLKWFSIRRIIRALEASHVCKKQRCC